MYKYNPKALLYYLRQNVSRETLVKQSNKSNVEYYNIACGFDIETTSIMQNEEKYAFMYIWQLGIRDFICYGRTWDEFIQALSIIQAVLHLDDEKRIIIYVHNLAYEFQFMRKYIEWLEVFSLDERKPLKALSAYGIEFRCSYMLSGLSLALTAKNLTSHKLEKLTGDLNYNLIRHAETPLTEKELLYCEYDIKIILAYINEQIAEYYNIAKIPLTNTGRVRQFVREKCFYGFGKKKSFSQYQRYQTGIHSLNLNADSYKMLKYCFQGGFTHANYEKVGKKLEKVYSIDFTSSYPAVMLTELYPMSTPKLLGNVSRETMLNNMKLKYKGYMFIARFTNIHSIKNEMYISEHKCTNTKNISVNNGRVHSADELTTFLTNIDFNIIEYCYTWDNVEFFNVYEFILDYLPKPIIQSIIELYKKKTELKGVEGMENEYLKSKGMLNSVYGMCVTDIMRDDILYENENWSSKTPNIDDKIEVYNESKNRFLYYPWGVWVTAYARRNLWTGILSIQDDYVYSDTDSIKFQNINNHTWYIEKYNKNIEKKLQTMCKHYNIHFSDLKPKTIKGEEKLIGVWDYEGEYKYFKTLGAKRYIYYTDKLHITVAGLSKNHGGKYLTESNGADIEKMFNAFNNDLYIPAEYTNKKTHTYLDDLMEIDVQDYKGNKLRVIAKSGIHLGECDFTLSLSRQYENFLKMFVLGYTYKDNEY
jgi:hypothetical protein